MTQPPLSKAIHQLEQSVGVQLFERDGKHVALTVAGEVMLPKARETLRHAHNMAELDSQPHPSAFFVWRTAQRSPAMDALIQVVSDAAEV
jgi:DNA-binding transcriptional LysR family regulator